MVLAQSKLTSQGQVSIPADVRRRLGIATGSVLEWLDNGHQVIVRRAALHTSQDIHRVLFSRAPAAQSFADLKEGIRRHMKKRHARH